ncbi:MAG: NAD-dependent epimerase/dehydratase family protein [Chloroflexi bacterium]|nr:MAG: NAD-dependent epimerase/dehydratase family protein [Chloroflexota bacterium]
MKYYVTGATGFIGGHVARQLIASGHTVIAPVRTPAKAQDLVDLGVNVVKGDVTDKESMRASMTGVDGVFHIAGWYKIGVKDKSMGMNINVDGTRNVLQLMKELNIPKGVYTSTLAVNSDTRGKIVDETYYHPDDGHWVSEYDRTKWVAHYAVAMPMVKEGLPLVTVMPGLVYGPGDTSSVHETFVQYLRRKLPMVPAQTTYCWAHVDDIARGHILAMEKGTAGEEYIIAGPVARVVEVLEIAEKITAVPAPRLHPSFGAIKAMASLMGILEKVIPLPESYTAESLRVTTATYLGSNEKARRELGYTLRPLEEGLRETLLYEMRKLGMQLPKI